MSQLPVVETFHSLQGEGVHAGRSAFFIRLAGCSVGCSWCDTKHSWPAAAHPVRSVADLAAEARQASTTGAGFVVITGGEPLHHDLEDLTAALEEGARIPLHLETSGVDRLSGRFDWITLSPKRHNPPLEGSLRRCHELKVVIHGPEDLDFAEAMAGAAVRLRKGSGERAPVLLLQAGWESREGERLALEHVRSHPGWRLSLQLHKMLGVR